MPFHLFIQTEEGALDYRGSSPSREKIQEALVIAEEHHLKAMICEEVGMTSRRVDFKEAEELVNLADSLKVEFLENYLLEQGEGGHA